MGKAIVFSVGLLMLATVAGSALASAGGAPNSNALGPASNNGRKAQCVPPGSVLKGTAKLPGPNNTPFGLVCPPGRWWCGSAARARTEARRPQFDHGMSGAQKRACSRAPF